MGASVGEELAGSSSAHLHRKHQTKAMTAEHYIPELCVSPNPLSLASCQPPLCTASHGFKQHWELNTDFWICPDLRNHVFRYSLRECILYCVYMGQPQEWNKVCSHIGGSLPCSWRATGPASVVCVTILKSVPRNQVRPALCVTALIRILPTEIQYKTSSPRRAKG